MAALTADLGIEVAGEIEVTDSYPVQTNVVIYQGATICLDTAGYAVPAANTLNFRVIGVALHAVNTTGVAAGVKSVQVGEGRVVRAHTGLTQAMAGKKVYVADDQTVTNTPGNSVFAGIFRRFEPSGKALVEMGSYLTTVAA